MNPFEIQFLRMSISALCGVMNKNFPGKILKVQPISIDLLITQWTCIPLIAESDRGK